MDKDVPVSVWPEWELIEKIGEGSFGKVYKRKRDRTRPLFLLRNQDHIHTGK